MTWARAIRSKPSPTQSSITPRLRDGEILWHAHEMFRGAASRWVAVVAGASVAVAVAIAALFWGLSTAVDKGRGAIVRDQERRIEECAGGSPAGSDRWGVCEAEVGTWP